jgi:hypothetical protein
LSTTGQLIGYISTRGGFCNIDPATAALSNCFLLPYSIGPTPLCYFERSNNMLYFTTTNYSDPTAPFLLVAVDVFSSTHESWSVSLVKYSMPKTGPVIGYSSAYGGAIVWGSSVVLAKPDDATVLFGATVPYAAGTFNPWLLSFWSAGNQMLQLSLASRNWQFLDNTFNIVTVAIDPNSKLYYGLAQAAQSVLLYMWDFNYPATLRLVGIIPDAVVYPSATTSIDSQRRLTFVSHAAFGTTLVTVSLEILSVIRSPQLPYPLQTFTYTK